MQIPDILKSKWTQMISVGVVALATGSVGGYILGKKQGKVTIAVNTPKPQQMTIYDVTSREVVQEDHLSSLINREVILPPLGDDEDENLIDRIVEAQHEDPAVVAVNVWTVDDVNWVWEDELSIRKQAEPYVIHVEEFVANDLDFRQETLTYYRGDDIMADGADTPIYDYGGLMGNLKFGHGSRDPNIVYIRNEVIRMEWEVLLHLGRFEVEVLGEHLEEEAEQDEIKHSMVQKFRAGD